MKWIFVLIACAAATRAEIPTSPADSLASFKPDSLKTAAIRSLEAGGKAPGSLGAGPANLDSLKIKLHHRRPFLGATLGLSFSTLSVKTLFSAHVDSIVRRDSLRVLQPYDPVHVYFPVGLIAAVPLFTYLDLWLRTEHFWYQMSALAQGAGPPREFSYAVQGQLFGAGGRYLIPVSLLTVNNRAGLYLAYTRFWNFPPTEMYAPTGVVRARMKPAGAGYEIQAGYQQDFDKRWTVTGGLAFASLDFESRSPWKAILPFAPDEKARWNLRSLRLSVQGLYQFKFRP